MITRQGIVLRSQMPKKGKIVLLDADRGKIECFHWQFTFSYGMLLEYTLEKKRVNDQLSKAEIVKFPVIKNNRDIFFIHRVLELAYYFLPLESPVPEIFDLFSVFYTLEERDICAFELAFLGKFFALLGLLSENNAIEAQAVCQLYSFSLPDLTEQIASCAKINIVVRNLIDRCMAEYPRVQCFKTSLWFK